MIHGNFIIASLISVIVWVICRICKCVKNKRVNIFREFILFVFFIYFLVLLKLTLFKWGLIELTNQFNSYMYRQYGIFGIINIVPFKETINVIADSNISLKNSLTNVVGNILVFMPLGFFISMLFEKHNNLKKVLKIGFLSSLCIEICQLFVGLNVCDIDDVIYNTVGAVIGFICFRTFETIIEKVNLKEKLNKIRDFHTENIFKKVVKGISIVGVIVVMSYIYAFYNQTALAEISMVIYPEMNSFNEEELNKIYSNEKNNIINVKFIDNMGKDIITINDLAQTIE